MKISTSMNFADEALLQTVLDENSEGAIRRKLVKKYNNYFRHW